MQTGTPKPPCGRVGIKQVCKQVCPGQYVVVQGRGNCVNRHAQAAYAVLGYPVGVNRHAHASVPQGWDMLSPWDLTDMPTGLPMFWGVGAQQLQTKCI